MINFVIGFMITFGLLFVIGLTKARKMSDRIWCIWWVLFSSILIIIIIFGMIIDKIGFYRGILGMASAYIISVSIHVYTHTKNNKNDSKIVKGK